MGRLELKRCKELGAPINKGFIFVKDGFSDKLFALGLSNCNTFQGLSRWREIRWTLGDLFIDYNTGLEVHQSIHAFVGPELHLDKQGIWKGEQWAKSSGLDAILAAG